MAVRHHLEKTCQSRFCLLSVSGYERMNGRPLFSYIWPCLLVAVVSVSVTSVSMASV